MDANLSPDDQHCWTSLEPVPQLCHGLEDTLDWQMDVRCCWKYDQPLQITHMQKLADLSG